MTRKKEVFVSVDVETAGPIPGEYSLLSIGACAVADLTKTFSCELKPINRNADPKALEVSGLSLDELEAAPAHHARKIDVKRQSKGPQRHAYAWRAPAAPG